MTSSATTETQAKPILLFDDQCAVCRRIARWVSTSALSKSGEASITERPIGNDPDDLKELNPRLDIWEAYKTIHVVMPDGSMKLGGEAVAEVLRNLRSTRWFAGCFALSVLGFRPFQLMLNLAYAILADLRPLLGCESCGTPSRWVSAIRWLIERPKAMFGKARKPNAAPHFTALSTTGRRP